MARKVKSPTMIQTPTFFSRLISSHYLLLSYFFCNNQVALQHTLGSPSAKLTASGRPKQGGLGSAMGSKRGAGLGLGHDQRAKGPGEDDSAAAGSGSIPYESYSPFSNRSISCLFTQVNNHNRA